MKIGETSRSWNIVLFAKYVDNHAHTLTQPYLFLDQMKRKNEFIRFAEYYF